MFYSRDEMDLVNIVGFVWKWKRWIAAGATSGLLLAAALVAFVHLDSSADPQFVHWSATASFPKNLTQSEIDSASIALGNFIENSIGNAAVVQSLVEASSQASNLSGDWLSCFGSEHCLLQKISMNGTTVVIVANHPKNLKEEEVQRHLLIVLKKFVSKYNEQYANKQGTRDRELSKVQSRIAQLRNKGLELFAQHSMLSSDSKNSIMGAVTSQLLGEKTSDVFTFLLGSVPDSNPQKILLTAEYEKLQATRETLIQKTKAVAKALGVEKIVHLPEFAGINNFQLLPSERTGLSNVVATKPLPIIVLGLLIGGFFGTLLAFGFAFWKRNCDRIYRIAGRASN
jgi:hypothetical protein